MNDPTLFLNHTHTYRSNDFEEAITGEQGTDHHTDYLAITEQLPDDVSIVYNRTEHFKTGEKLYDEIRNELDEHGEPYEQYERHLWFERDGTEAAIINSVEASLEQDNWHVLITGLPIEDETYHNISRDELYDIAEDAGWFAPAHPFINDFRIDDQALEQVFDHASGNDDIEAAICYSTGYTSQVNSLAQGRETRTTRLLETIASGGSRAEDSDVLEYAEEYDLGLVPELDIHATLPDGLEGAGVIEDSIMDDLQEGTLEESVLLDTAILSYSGPGNEGLSWRQFITTFPSTVPLSSTGLLDRFLPSDTADFREHMEHRIKDLQVDKQAITANTYDPTQWDGHSS